MGLLGPIQKDIIAGTFGIQGPDHALSPVILLMSATSRMPLISTSPTTRQI